jgi:hypothetical protein
MSLASTESEDSCSQDIFPFSYNRDIEYGQVKALYILLQINLYQNHLNFRPFIRKANIKQENTGENVYRARFQAPHCVREQTRTRRFYLKQSSNKLHVIFS